MEAIRLTINDTYNSQLKLLQEQLSSERDTALQCQYDELTAAYHENLEVLQHELEELEERAGKSDTIKSVPGMDFFMFFL